MLLPVWISGCELFSNCFTAIILNNKVTLIISTIEEKGIFFILQLIRIMAYCFDSNLNKYPFLVSLLSL